MPTPLGAINVNKFTNGADAYAAPGPYVPVGAPVTWEYVVTNAGYVELDNVTVTDSDPGVSITCPKSTLAPGEAMVCWGNGTAVAGQYKNVAADAGTPPGGLGPVTDTDPSHYFGFDGPPPPTIAYDPDILRFRIKEGYGRLLKRTLNIENSGEPGCTPLKWVLSDDAEWLATSATSGITPCGSQDTIVVLVDASDMSAGTYSATITIEAPGATNTPQFVEVVLTIRPGRGG